MLKRSLFAAVLISLVLLPKLCPSVSAAPLTLAPEPFTQHAVTAVYDPASGNLSIKSDVRVTSFELTSSNSLFIPEAVNQGVLESPFDVLTESKWFVLDVEGFTDLDVGPIYPAGMDINSMLADLNVDGSLDGGGGLDRDLSSSPHLYIVPEPSGQMLLALAAATLLTTCFAPSRRRSRGTASTCYARMRCASDESPRTCRSSSRFSNSRTSSITS